MTSGDAKMLLALVGSLVASTVTVATTRRDAAPTAAAAAARADTLVDETGTPAPRKHYARIASGSILADRLLLELCEPERIVGLSGHGQEGSSIAFRYGSSARIEVGGDIEAIIALRPDLLLVNDLTDQRRITRLREAGIVVFDLGPMRGLRTLLGDITQVAALLGVEARGRMLADATLARMNATALDIPIEKRKTAVYVAVHGPQFYGGTRGTSYHDVLAYAGLIDRAADTYADWPAYTPEMLRALNPEVLVTTRGNATRICRHPSLLALRACSPQGQVVEIDSRLVVDPSLAMVDAAMLLRTAVYGAVPARQ